MADLLWKQQLNSAYGKDMAAEIDQVRRFLSPSDSVVERLVMGQLRSRSHHVEFTCEWFDSSLQEFIHGNDNVFLITGKPGCGKTVLCQWMVERLRRQQERDNHDVLSFVVEGDIKTEASPLSVPRSLLFQLFDNNIGNTELYEQVAALVQRSMQDKLALEQALWTAIEAGLKHKRTILVVDGLDQLIGGQDTSVRVLDRLHQVTSKCPGTKAIVLSEPLKKPGSNRSRQFNIDKKHVQQDMERVLDGVVASAFPPLSAHETSSVVQRLVSFSDGSFTHAMLVLEIAKREKTFSGIMSTLDSAPATMVACVQQLLGMLDMGQRDTRSILAWLLAAQRPLTVTEMKTLLSVDMAQMQTSTRITDVQSDLHNAVGPLIRMEDGVVRFKHPLIRQNLTELARSVKDYSNKDARFPFNLQEAHYDLVNRCLAVTKISLTEHVAPSSEPGSSDLLMRLFQRHGLLEYTSRYWAIDFMHSPMYQKDGKHKLTNEFKSAFPSSTALAVLEYTCWDSQILPQETVGMFELALQLRRSVVPEHKEAILQTLVSVSRTYERMTKTKEASTHFYDAFCLGRPILGENNGVLAAVTIGYINSTKSSEKLEIREQMLQYLIAYQKLVRGASNLTTIRYTRMLVALHKQEKKMDRAIELQEELYQMCIEYYGTQHEKTTAIHEGLVSLLREAGRTDQLTRHEISKYDRTRHTLSLADSSLVAAALKMVSYYESQKQLDKAEQVLTELWESITDAAQSRKTVSLQERKIEVAMEYHKFLEKQGRTDDAKNVLIGIWIEYQDTLDKSQTMADVSETELSTLLAVGRTMQQYRSLDMAKTIFNSLWSYFRRVDQQTSELAVESALNLSNTSKELMETQMTSTTVEEEVSEESIMELEEIFESITTITSMSTNMSVPETNEKKQSSASAHSSIMATAEMLTSFYVEQERWSEATSTTIKALQIAWPSVIDGGTPMPPSEHRIDAVMAMAKRLALCYFKKRQISKAEEVHVHVFQATKSMGVQNVHFRTATDELVEFYETIYQFYKAVDVLTEVSKMQKASLKDSDAAVIRTSYRLGRLCRDLEMNENAKKMFLEIVRVLGRDNDMLGWDSVEAALMLGSIYTEEQQWEKARQLYARLWKTFLTQRDGYQWTWDCVEKFYGVYFDVLEKKVEANYSTLLQVATEYRQRVVELFGDGHELTTKATLHLAAMYERSEEHREQAISMYEKALSSSSSTTSKTMQQSTTRKLTQSQQRLAHLYSKQTRTSSKGISLYQQEIRNTASSHGYASSQTLQQLHEFITLTVKTESKESRDNATELLQTSIREIIVNEKSTQKQVASAHTIARMFLQLKERQTAVNLLGSMRRQVITEEYESDTKFSLVGAGQHSFAFIVAFEEALLDARHQRFSFSELMATLMTERLLYQSYTRATKAGDSSFELIFTHGCRLATFYKQHQRVEEHQKIETDLLKRFARAFQATESSSVLRHFFSVCIQEMGSANKQRDDSVPIVSTVSTAVREHLEAGRFHEGCELAGFLDRFLRLYGAYGNQANMETAFKLSLWLAGRGGIARRCPDKKLQQKMQELSAAVLGEVLRVIDRLHIKFTDMPLADLNELVGLLGEQQNWDALETILSTAWSSRHTSSPSPRSWSPTTAVALGARLAQVRFLLAGPRRAQALRLAEDMAYNLRRVWGLHDAATLRAFGMLAALRNAAGDVAGALAVREHVLRGTLEAVEDGVLGAEEGAVVAAGVFGALREAFTGWGGGGVEVFKGLQGRFDEVLVGQKAWLSCGAAQEGVERWVVSKEKGKKVAAVEKAWMPDSWEFLEKGGGEAGGAVHRNNLRRTSGLETTTRPTMLYADDGNGGGGVKALAADEKGTGAEKEQDFGGESPKTLHEVRQVKGQKLQSDDEMLRALEGGAVGGSSNRVGATVAPLLLSFHAVSAQIPQAPSDVTTITAPNGATIRYKEPGKSGICETTPGVNSYSGFIDTSPTRHTFFWLFESRNDPENDPLTVWINGGPGSDSLVGVFTGNGPCSINDDGTTEINPLSWNNVSNVLYLSQPVGTGFSYADLEEGSLDETSGQFLSADLANVTGVWPVVNETTVIDTSEDAAVAAWEIVQAFYSALPILDPKIKSKEFNLWTVSYGGHYAPAIMKHFKEQNDEIAAGNANGTHLELKSLGLGNAYIDAAIQAPFFPTFATNNTYNITAYNSSIYDYSQVALNMPGIGCLAQLSNCAALQEALPRNPTRDAVCAEAWHSCFDNVEGLYRAFSGLDRFDIRLNESESLFVQGEAIVAAYLNVPEVQDAIGVASNYTPESAPVMYAFFQSGDGALSGFREALGELADAGVSVLLFNGDADYACNWLGGEAVALAVNYTGAEDFAAAEYTPYVVDGKEYGQAKQHDKLAFLRVYEAGHIVQEYQPGAMLDFFNKTIHGESL
ncbi:Nacht domain protein [Neofusicoccum parvum]|uniref:Nacht domain protein n=1 Tax=Neofusicoccum parvum TaxID=310453 RepID=A0ACB5SJ54_9PEZI|nr:Nacht domain protein [Neofusicoccum parvum]